MEKYVLNLTADERAALTELYERGRISALRRKRAGIMLRADEGWTDAEIAEELEVGASTVERIRKRAVFEGVKAALERRVQVSPSREPRLDGRAEAQLVQLACSAAPKGHARWTLTLLADRLVELNVVESVSTTTVHRRLKKTLSSPG